MISYLRGPGGPLARIAAEWVPFSVAVLVGGSAISLVSPLSAALIGAAVWPLVSAVLRWVRRRPRLRRVYRVALLAHVVFWSAQGLLGTQLEPAAAPTVAGASAWEAGGAFRAGYAEQAFALPPWTSLAGWGSRPRRIRFPALGGIGVLGRASQSLMGEPDDSGRPRLPMFRGPESERAVPTPASQLVGARALVLRPAAGGPPVAILRLDLVTSDLGLHKAIAARVHLVGIRPEGLLVAATHTHSGPGGYSDNPLSALFGTDHFSPVIFEAIVNASVQAILAAFNAAVPARVALALAHDRDATTGKPIVGRNRRAGDEDAIDDRVYALCFDGRDDGRPIAVVLNYALHPHIYRRRHMAFDRDLAGGIEEAVGERLGGTAGVLFVNGAQGDVGTRRGGGTPAARIEALAEAFAGVVVPAIEAARRSSAATLRVACARVDQTMATPRIVIAALGARAGVLDVVDRPYTDVGVERTLADVLALPINIGIWAFGMPEVRFGFGWEGDVGIAMHLGDTMGNPVCPFSAWVFESGVGTETMRFALLSEPGEAVQALGRAWRDEAAQRGVDHTLVLGLTNGSCAYLTPEAAYRRDGYEAEATMYGPKTGATATAALTTALDAALALLAR